jgi:hypothetical protein
LQNFGQDLPLRSLPVHESRCVINEAEQSRERGLRKVKFQGGTLWSSGQSSWLQIQRPRVRFPGTTKKIVGLERGPLGLVSTTEELHDRKVAGPV